MKSYKNLATKNCAKGKRLYDMAMSLTNDDLKSIQHIVDKSIFNNAPKVVQPMLNELEDRLVATFDDMQKDINNIGEGIKDLKVSIRRIELRDTLRA